MDTFKMHPNAIPFLTAMEVNSRNSKLQPFIAPINHNTLTSSKVIQIMQTSVMDMVTRLVS